MEKELYTPEDCRPEMIRGLLEGKEKGTTTYIHQLDEYWTWRKSEANIWTGYSSEGKSEFLRFLCLIKSLEENWKITLNAPEDFPAHEMYDSLVHTLSGLTTDKYNTIHNTLITEEMYNHCVDLIANRFNFLYIKPPHNTIEECLKEFQLLHDKDPQDVFILDPLMKFQKSKSAPDRDDSYATYVDTLLTDFARRNNVCVKLVIHQLTPRVNQTTGLYDEVSGYQIKGGGSWMDGIDNVLFVQRPYMAKDKLRTEVKVGSLKIKKHKLTGIPGHTDFLFDRKTNRYTDLQGNDLYNFDKWMPNYRKKLAF